MSKTFMRVKRGMVFWIEDTVNTDKYNATATISFKGKLTTIHTSVMAGSRPWLVVSCDENNSEAPTCNVVPISTSKDRYQKSVYHVAYTYKNDYQSILIEQIKTVDIQALGEYIFTLSDRIMQDVEQCLAQQFSVRQKLSCTEDTLIEVMKLIEPSIEKVIQKKIEQSSSIVPVRNIEDLALKIGQTLEDLFRSSDPAPIPDSSNESEILVDEQEEQEKVISETRGEVEEITDNADQAPQPLHVLNEILDDCQATNEKSRQKIPKKEKKKIVKNDPTTKTVKEIPQGTEKKRPKSSVWPEEKKIEFLIDCDTLTKDEMMEKYEIPTLKAYYMKRYHYKHEK